MLTKLTWDGTPEDMERLKTDNSGLYLTEVQNHLDGDFLVFGQPPQPSLEQRLTAIETRTAALERKPQ